MDVNFNEDVARILETNARIFDNYKYIVNEKYSKATAENMHSVLNQFFNYANKIQKTVYDFVYQDFLQMYKSYKWTQKGVFDNRKNVIAGLLDYLYENNMCTEQYLSMFKGIYNSEFDNTTLFKTDYYKDFTELSSLVKTLYDKNDDDTGELEAIGVIYLLWCGLTFDDICTLTSDDFDGKCIYIKSTDRLIEIPHKEISDVITEIKNKTEYVKKVRKVGSTGRMTKGNIEYDYKVIEYENQDVIFKSRGKTTKGVCTASRLRSLVSSFNKKGLDLPITNELYGKVIRGNAIYKNGIYVRLKEIEDTKSVTIEKWSSFLIHVLDEHLNGEILNKGEINNTIITRTTSMISSYLQWRSFYYGY